MAKIDKTNIRDILALTPMQDGMLFHYLKEPKSDLYREQLCLALSGEIQQKLFEKAWNFVIAANEMLRTAFRWEGLENPIQIILKEHYLQLEFYDFTGKSKQEIDRSTAEVKKSEREKIAILQDEVPFRAALCKIEKDRYEMIISNHHILYDGWSNGIILKEFFHAYSDFTAAKDPVIPTKTKFKEFVKWLQNREKHKQAEYWENYLQGFDAQTELSIKKRGEKETISAGNLQTRLQKPIKDKIEDFVKEHKITAASLFYGCWGLLLHRYNNCEDVVFGTTISGRPAGIRGIENMVGLFINTIPLRVQTGAGGGEKIIDLLHRIDDTLKERAAYENTPLVEIREYSALGVQEELFDNIVAIENYPLENVLRGGESGGLAMDSHSMFENTHYDLTLGVTLFAQIELNFGYRAGLFEDGTILGLAGHFCRILQDVMADPGKVVSQIDMLSADEKNRLLYEWNNTDASYPQDKTIHELFAEQADRAPDRVAIVVGRVGPVGPVGHVCLTYRELNGQADGMAGLLLEKGVQPDTIVGIMVEPSVEMMIGIIGILKSGGAYLPIDPEYPRERIDYMLKDSGAQIMVGNRHACSEIHHSSFIIHHSSQLAYVIYTSGTTGKPKGVLATQRSVIRLIKNTNYIEFMERDRILQGGAITFDASTFEIWGALLNGSTLVFLPKDYLLNPVLLKKAMQVFDITIVWMTSPLFNRVLDEDEDIFAGLRYLLVGGDILSPIHINRARRRFPGLNITNGYGPTENTTFSTTFPIDREYTGNIPIGTPIANSTVYIIDKYNNLSPIGVPGELCVGGDGIARGYLNNPELTAEKFKRIINDNSSNFPNDQCPVTNDLFYKTGDRACWLPDGNIEFLGRIDYQVKIRGFRIEPGEIENRLLKHGEIKDALVLAKEDITGDKYLAAYFISDRELPDAKLREHLLKDLPDYMIPSYFVRLEKIPLTPTGKVDRGALPAPKIKEIVAYVAPRDQIEMKLAEIWAGILGINIALNRIGIDDNFFELGGHSLKATTLVLKIHKIFDVNIPLSRVFQLATIRRLAESIAGAAKDRFVSLEAAEKKEYYALSPAQKRLYILQQMEETRTSYNMFHAVVLKGDLSKETLVEVFRKLIRRHESLRTSFEMIGNEPVQRIHDAVEFEIEISANIKYFIRPFDLSKAPLIRAGLIKEADKRHILVLDMHHIVVDGTSVAIFIDEFVKLYSGLQLAPVKLQYKDFSEGQRKWFASGGLKSREEYWLKQFKGEVPLLNLPFDYERPAVQSFDFDRVVFEADKELTAKIKKLVSETGATLYMVLLAAYCILLAKYGDQEDIVVGTGVVGRTHPDTEQIIGMFVNMLALRSRPTGNKSFGIFLEELKGGVLAAFENQDYPFDELVKKLNLKREYGRNPLFDTEFTFQDAGVSSLEIPGLIVEPYEYENSLLKFDLSLTAFEADGQIHLILGFSPRLFKRATIETMAKHFVELLEQFPGNNNKALKELKITVEHRLSAAETAFSRSDYSGFEF